MLSLLRWGLGSGHEHLSDKERMEAVEKHHARASNGAVLTMDSSRPPVKRKRVEGPVSGQIKQAKRCANGTARPVSAGASDTLRVVNSPGAALLAQQAEMGAASPPLNLVTAPTISALHASAKSLLDQENLGVIDLSTPVDASVPAMAVPTDKLQQTIATEFGIEILLKHNELRLIDQEIAKCQVALEQLRRCQAIPFPSQSVDPQQRLKVSGGVGRPLRTPHLQQASQPPPWGVVDGPYSRHYAQWLLPDPTFDGGVTEDYLMHGGRSGKMLPDRHTRGSKGEQFLLASKRLRGLPTSSRLQALPAGYPEPKEHKGPMILKRAADDKLVKLVCLDCKREDFNSAQGFINHCRIAHSRGFASHEAAAQACGQEVEPSDVAPPPVNTPAEPSTGMLTPSGVMVHPLIKSNATVPTLSIPVPRAQRAAQSTSKPIPLLKSLAKTAEPAMVPQVPLTAVPDTPHLSKLFAFAGHGGDLSSLVSDAKTREELEASSDEEGAESDFDEGETSDASTAPPMARIPSRGGMRAGPVKSTGTSTHPEAQKGVGRPNRRAGTTHANEHNTVSSSLELPVKPHDLSPHTIESNNAPSLVSDDDDEYEDGHTSTSPSTHTSDGEEDEHVDVDVEVEEMPRLRGNHLEPPRVMIPSKSEDPELQASSKVAKAASRRGPRGAVAKPEAPKKRGRPRKVQT